MPELIRLELGSQRDPPVVSFLGVPLRLMDKPIGMIGLANRPEPYDVEHEQLLMTYAAQIATVIRNAQLYEELTAAKKGLERKVVNCTQQLEETKESLAQKATQLQKLLNEMVDIEERERHRIFPIHNLQSLEELADRLGTIGK